MTTATQDSQLAPGVHAQQPSATAPGGDPAILGLPIFAVGAIALAFTLVGYVPPAASGVIIPVIFAATALGLAISTVWAAALGQTMVACIFGLFSGFWFSLAVLLLGLDHNWLAIPASAVAKSVALYLISLAIVFAVLTVATIRLPVSFTIVIGLVVVALVLRTIGVLDASTTANTAAGAVAFVFAAIGLYLFLGAAETASGGGGLPLGRPLRA
jgi:succinate-acetate transporter protein